MPTHRLQPGGFTRKASLRIRNLVSFPVILGLLFAFDSASAQVERGWHKRAQITQSIDESQLITLHGNTHPKAKAENDRGPVDDSFQMEHLVLQLKRSPEQEQALQQFIEELHTATSPNFHRWLTPQNLETGLVWRKVISILLSGGWNHTALL